MTEISKHFCLVIRSYALCHDLFDCNLLFCRTSGTYAGSFQRRRFTNEDFMVTLPAGVDACDIGTITIWCQPFCAIFTRLAIPSSTFVSACIWFSYYIIYRSPSTHKEILIDVIFSPFPCDLTRYCA